MAGGKETPRQKMIGMMYLVLTALLALNVSSAVLEKFAILNTTLSELIAESDASNAKLLLGIKDSKSKDEKVVDAVRRAEEIRAMTKDMLKYLDGVKEELAKDGSGKPMVGGELISNTNVAEEKMLDENSKLAPEYEKRLNDYHSKLEELAQMKFPKLTKKAEDFKELRNENGEVEHGEKNFIEFSFEGTPTMPAIASVTQMQTEILDYEGAALDSINAIAQGVITKFDVIVPMVIGPSVVASGAKYEGQLFMAGAASGASPQMFRNGQPLTVTEDNETKIKMAKVEFMAQASTFNASGIADASFEAVIKNAGKEYKRSIKYQVIRPVIRVTTGNAPTLYMNCGNTVNIEVPALGSTYQPSFSAKGATVEKGDKPGRVTIIPKERKVEITVSNGGATIGTEKFDVKPIPKPRYVPKDNTGKEVDLKNGVRSAGLTSLRVSAEPDDNFKQEVPRDAQYRIRSMEVILARGTSRVATINATSELLDLNAWRSQFRPGDRIIVDIKSVTRTTYSGEQEKVDIVGGTINIPIQ